MALLARGIEPPARGLLVSSGGHEDASVEPAISDRRAGKPRRTRLRFRSALNVSVERPAARAQPAKARKTRIETLPSSGLGGLGDIRLEHIAGSDTPLAGRARAGYRERSLPRVAILTHASDDFRAPYFLRFIAQCWREAGVEVLVHRGLGAPPPADLAILHVDLSVVPDAYAELGTSYQKVLNFDITDITKAAISRQLVRRGDGYEGPVIVKTNLNWGGVREATLERRPLRADDIKALLEYRIYPTVSDVPRAVWSDESRIVDRFLPEMRDDHYCLRTWMFLGDRETNSLSYSKSPIVKSSNVVRREVVPEVPEALRARRQELGVDYGKFDYVIRDGEVVLYDVNKTPSMGHLSSDTIRASMLELSRGLAYYGVT